MGLLLALFMMLLRFTGLPESIAFYHPMPLVGKKPVEVEDVYFKTSDGLMLHGWFIRGKGLAAGERGPVVLHAHGNAGSVPGHSGLTSFLSTSGISVLTFDYRDFGKSEKTPIPLSREALRRDTRGAYQYLLTRNEVDPDRIGAIGISLGGAFASSLTADVARIRSCCLVAGFASWQEVASDHVKSLGKTLISPGLDTVDSVKKFGTRPLLIVQGDRDPVVPYRHGKLIQKAAEECGCDVEFLRVPGAAHINVLSTDPSTKERISQFFVKTLAKPDSKGQEK